MKKFEYFASCIDTLYEVRIPFDALGYSAEHCFNEYETHGKLPACKEPELLSRALNGKKRHGILVDNCSKDYVDRILFARELNEYPKWVKEEILIRAKKISLDKFGFVLEFIETGEDFSTINFKDWLKKRNSKNL